MEEYFWIPPATLSKFFLWLAYFFVCCLLRLSVFSSLFLCCSFSVDFCVAFNMHHPIQIEAETGVIQLPCRIHTETSSETFVFRQTGVSSFWEYWSTQVPKRARSPRVSQWGCHHFASPEVLKYWNEPVFYVQPGSQYWSIDPSPERRNWRMRNPEIKVLKYWSELRVP